MSINPPTNLETGLVSIGVPVYNGARYLREALESLVTQDYPHFEIIISDNASDDETEAICREFVAREPRVRYYRSEENKGPFWNFVNVYELARGEFFMWNAHDDRRDPRCVSLCVEAFREHPEAVMCCMGVRFIDEDGRELPDIPVVYHPTGPTRRERLRQLARTALGSDFYSLFKTSVIGLSRFGKIKVWGGDTVTTAEICMLGEVVAVPEALFYYRVFRDKGPKELAESISGWGTEISPSWIGLVAELIEAVHLSPLGAFEKMRLKLGLAIDMCVREAYWSDKIRQNGFSGLSEALNKRQYRRAFRLTLLGSLNACAPAYNRLLSSFRHRLKMLKQVLRPGVAG